MKFKKIIASAAVAAVTAAAVILSVNAGTAGKAWVCAADDTWDVQYWGSGNKNNSGIVSAVDAEITGDGVYTVSVEFEHAINYGQYFALGTDFEAAGSKKGEASFADYPEAKLSVISVKADGVEIQGDKSVCDMNYYDTMAVYIYNPWEDGKYNYTENLDWTEGIISIEITFRVTGLDTAEESVIPGEISSVVPIETQITENTSATTETAAPVSAATEITTEEITETVTQTMAVTTEETTEFVTQATTAATEKTTESVTKTTTVTTETVTEDVTAETAQTTRVTTETSAAASETAETPYVSDVVTEKTASDGVISDNENSNQPSADSVTDNANTGNTSAKGIAALMGCAVLTAILSKKGKNDDNVF